MLNVQYKLNPGRKKNNLVLDLSYNLGQIFAT